MKNTLCTIVGFTGSTLSFAGMKYVAIKEYMTKSNSFFLSMDIKFLFFTLFWFLTLWVIWINREYINRLVERIGSE